MLYIITKKNLSFFEFLLSCPLFIFLISTQKLQLFFGLLFLVLFILVQKNKIKSRLELFLFVTLISFYASGKIYYILLSLILIVYFLIKNQNKIKDTFLFGLINFFLIFLPIFLIKYKFFGNPLAPFFDDIFGSSRSVFINYSLALRESQGWLSNYKNYLIYIKPFIPLTIGDLTNNLGLIFLLLFFNYKLQKELNFIPVIIIIIILFTGQILSRYYLSISLLIYFSFGNNNNLIKYIKYLQMLVVTIFATIFVYVSYINFKVVIDKSNYMNNFSYGYYNNSMHNKYYDKGNVLLLNQLRANIFSEDNVISRSYLDMSKTYNNNYDKFIDEKNILYVISNNENSIQSNCFNLTNIEDFNGINASRNF